MTNTPSDSPSRTRNVWLALAVVWFVGFLAWFNTFELPNNAPISRADVWWVLLVGSDEQPDDSSSIANLAQRLDLLAVAGAIVLAAGACGRLVLRGLGIGESLTRIERIVFSLALGLAGLSLLTLGAGLAGLLNRTILGGAMASLVIVELLLRFRRRERSHEVELPREPAGRRLKWACAIAIAPFLFFMLLGAMLPSIDFDVKAYHLQGPKEFYQNGRVGFLPHNVYTSFPFLTEMLSLLAMVLRDDWFRGALAGKAVLMGFAPITGLALYAAGRRWFGETVGWLAALIYLTTPWTYRVSVIAYAEGGLTCYLFVSLFALLLTVERFRGSCESASDGGMATGNRNWVLLTGLLAGCAMACKYPGVVQVVIPIGLALFLGRYLTCGCAITAIRAGVVYAIGVLIAVGPWLVKNGVETGNPVYPLLWTVFGGRDWNAELNDKWRAGHSPDHHALSDLAEKLVDVTAKSDWLSPLLFGLAPLALLALAKPAGRIPREHRPPGGPQVSPDVEGDLRSDGVRGRETRAQQGGRETRAQQVRGREARAQQRDDRARITCLWLYVVFLFLAWWVLTHRIDRFWIPMVPVVALLAGVGVTWSRHRLWVVVATVAIAATVAFNLRYVTTSLCGYNGYFADSAAARQQSERTAAGVKLLNRLPKEAKVLCVGEAQVFDARRSVAYNTVFDRSIFEQCTAGGRNDDGEMQLLSGDVIHRKLADEGITHIYVNWQEVLRYRLTYGYTEFVTPQRFRALEAAGVIGEPVFDDDASSFIPWDSLPQQTKDEVRRWAPDLKTTYHGTPALRRFVIYPVLR